MAVCSSIPTKNGIALRKIFDKQGRILLPANLREYAGIDKEVVSVGVYSRVEIWSKDRYLENSDFDDMDEIADHMAELGIGI